MVAMPASLEARNLVLAGVLNQPALLDRRGDERGE